MSTEIRCPMCSKPNPADALNCEHCGARLVPMGSLGEEAKTPPAEESLSPEDFLASLMREEENEKMDLFPAEDEAAQDEQISDWLDGSLFEEPLASDQGDTLAETADWLTDNAAQPESMVNEGEIADWLQDLNEEEEQQPAEETPDWLTELGVLQDETEPEAEDEEPILLPFDEPQTNEPVKEPEELPLPDWFTAVSPVPGLSAAEIPAESASVEETLPLPDWFTGAGAEPESVDSAAQESVPAEELPDWFTQAAPQPEEPAVSSSLPDWLSTDETTEPAFELPDWMKETEPESAPEEIGAPEPTAEETPSALPDWLRLEEEPVPGEPESVEPDTVIEGPAPVMETPELAELSTELPDWLIDEIEEEPAPEADLPEAILPEPELVVPTIEEVESETGAEPVSPAVRDENIPEWFAAILEGDEVVDQTAAEDAISAELPSVSYPEEMVAEEETAGAQDLSAAAEPWQHEDETMPEWFARLDMGSEDRAWFPNLEEPLTRADESSEIDQQTLDDALTIEPEAKPQGGTMQWLTGSKKKLSTEEMAALQAAQPPAPPKGGTAELPDWLLEEETAAEIPSPEKGGTAELPGWLLDDEEPSAVEIPSPEKGGTAELPGWLLDEPEPLALEADNEPALPEFSWMVEEPVAGTGVLEEEPAEAEDDDVGLPGWLGGDESALDVQSGMETAPAFVFDPELLNYTGEESLPDGGPSFVEDEETASAISAALSDIDFSAYEKEPVLPYEPEAETEEGGWDGSELLWTEPAASADEEPVEAEAEPVFEPEAEASPFSDIEAMFEEPQMGDTVSSKAALPAEEPLFAVEETEEPAVPFDPENEEISNWIAAFNAPTGATGALEESGPLRGMRGLLPSDPALLTYQRPAVYHGEVALTETDRQRAGLMKAILEAEQGAKPQAKPRKSHAESALRILLAVILIALVVSGLFAPPVSSSGLITNPPTQVVKFYQLLNNALAAAPEKAVLVVFDTQPAYSSELRAYAELPLKTLMEKNTRILTFSSIPQGTLIGADMMREVISDYYLTYSLDTQSANLGYLPGGSAAVRDFSASMRSVVHGLDVGISGQYIWDSPLTTDLNTIADFSMVIVVTDNLQNARIWVEQTGGYLPESTHLMMITSAQVSPMLRPYLNSGQIDGLIGSPLDAAAFATLSNQINDSILYWTSYRWAIYLMIAVIIIGAVTQVVRQSLPAQAETTSKAKPKPRRAPKPEKEPVFSPPKRRSSRKTQRKTSKPKAGAA